MTGTVCPGVVLKFVVNRQPVRPSANSRSMLDASGLT
jgi:hypothetical protein